MLSTPRQRDNAACYLRLYGPQLQMDTYRCTMCHTGTAHGWKNKDFLVNLNDVGPEVNKAINGTSAAEHLGVKLRPARNLGLRSRRSHGYASTRDGSGSNRLYQRAILSGGFAVYKQFQSQWQLDQGRLCQFGLSLTNTTSRAYATDTIPKQLFREFRGRIQ